MAAPAHDKVIRIKRNIWIILIPTICEAQNMTENLDTGNSLHRLDGLNAELSLAGGLTWEVLLLAEKILSPLKSRICFNFSIHLDMIQSLIIKFIMKRSIKDDTYAQDH